MNFVGLLVTLNQNCSWIAQIFTLNINDSDWNIYNSVDVSIYLTVNEYQNISIQMYCFDNITNNGLNDINALNQYIRNSNNSNNFDINYEDNLNSNNYYEINFKNPCNIRKNSIIIFEYNNLSPNSNIIMNTTSTNNTNLIDSCNNTIINESLIIELSMQCIF